MKELNENPKAQIEYFKLSLQYLHLVSTVIEELVNQGNKQIIISDTEISDEEFIDSIKWSAYNIIEPLLFNFYHGVELLLKGYLCETTNNNPLRVSHNIEKLLSLFKENFSDYNFTSQILSKYVSKNESLLEPLSSFFISNKIDVSKYFEALKYPANRGDIIFYNYDILRNMDEHQIDFFINLKKDIESLQKECVNFYREKYLS